MPRLIWVFAGRTLILLVLSCRYHFSVPVLMGLVIVWTKLCVFFNQNIPLLEYCLWMLQSTGNMKLWIPFHTALIDSTVHCIAPAFQCLIKSIWCRIVIIIKCLHPGTITKARNPYTRLRIRHATCGIRFQCIRISCVNAHASVYKDTLVIYLWILIVSISAPAYAYVHMDS